MTAPRDTLDEAAISTKPCRRAQRIQRIDMIEVVAEVRRLLHAGETPKQAADHVFRQWGFRFAIVTKGDDLHLRSE